MSMIPMANSSHTQSPNGSAAPGLSKGGEAVRTWRVGSISMGVTLMLIGTALAVSIWQDAEAYELMLWVAPIVFIMLGAELLLYLKFSGSERAIVKYDWVSVFFVGMIGTISLGLALLMSTGVFDELQRGLNTMQRSAFVSTSKVEVPSTINKLVVQSMYNVEVEAADSSSLQLIGQVRYWSADPLKQSDDKWLSTSITGNTMYVMVGSVDHKDGGMFSDQVNPQLTLLVPAGVEVVKK